MPSMTPRHEIDSPARTVGSLPVSTVSRQAYVQNRSDAVEQQFVFRSSGRLFEAAGSAVLSAMAVDRILAVSVIMHSSEGSGSDRSPTERAGEQCSKSRRTSAAVSSSHAAVHIEPHVIDLDPRGISCQIGINEPDQSHASTEIFINFSASFLGEVGRDGLLDVPDPARHPGRLPVYGRDIFRPIARKIQTTIGTAIAMLAVLSS